MEVGDGETEASGGLEATAGRVHADGGGCERVVGWKDEGAPVLAVMVWGFRWAGEDVMPSEELLVGWNGGRGRGMYSRMLASEGWATMYGGGFSEIVLYSRVSWEGLVFISV